MTVDVEKADSESGTVRCVCGSQTGAGTYTVEDQKLTLVSNFGTKTIHLGIQKPKALARKLLRNLCEKAGR